MKPETPIPVGGRMKFCPSEVILLQGDINYTKLFLSDGTTVIVGTTLGKLAARFATFNFFRTHKSFVVNLGFIEANQTFEEYTLRLMNNMEVSISRRKKTTFLKSITSNN